MGVTTRCRPRYVTVRTHQDFVHFRASRNNGLQSMSFVAGQEFSYLPFFGREGVSEQIV